MKITLYESMAWTRARASQGSNASSQGLTCGLLTCQRLESLQAYEFRWLQGMVFNNTMIDTCLTQPVNRDTPRSTKETCIFSPRTLNTGLNSGVTRQDWAVLAW